MVASVWYACNVWSTRRWCHDSLWIWPSTTAIDSRNRDIYFIDCFLIFFVPVTAGSDAAAASVIISSSLLFDKPYHHSTRSEEHTSELQSRRDLVCRLLLEK